MSKIIIALFVIVLLSDCNNADKKSKNTTTTVKDSSANTTSVKTIVFYGNSLTAGYGLSPTQAFPALIQNRIDSLGLPYKVVNAGVSGETSSGGLGRIDWILRQPVDVFVLELGANDGLRGIPVTETKKNLQVIMDKVKAKNPSCKIILAGMRMPPNMGEKYLSEFRTVYPELAKTNNIAFIPFILEGVGGEEKLNQADGIHPTTEGHRMIADNIWGVIKPML